MDLRTVLAVAFGDRADLALHPSQVAGNADHPPQGERDRPVKRISAAHRETLPGAVSLTRRDGNPLRDKRRK